jgi:2-polyprenyl-3-methyl-5-hydroxy-6-metoxy-1,4-benzoquinol methylase
MYFGGAGASPADYAGLAQARIDYMRSRIDRIGRMANVQGPLSMLDFGAATGEFVRAARDAGHHCTGIELSDDARATALQKNGVQLLPAHDAGDFEDAKFDVVHMNHVLEHMPDPLAHLRWCARVLKPGGLLVSEVPNQFDNDLDRLRRWLHAGGKRPQFDAYSLHHTYFFTPATMTESLTRAGFRLMKLATFNGNKTPLWPFKASNYLLWGLLGLSNWLHAGGNIIEVYARRES